MSDQKGLWRRLTEPAAEVRDAAERRTARLLSSLLLLIAPLGLLSAILQWLNDRSLGAQHVAVVASIGAVLFTYGLSRTRHFRIAGAITTLIPTAGGLAVLAADSTDPGWFAFMALNPALGTLLVGRWAPTLATANLAGVAAGAWLVADVDTNTAVVALMFNVIVSAVLLTAARHRDHLEHDRQAELLATYEALFEAQRMESVARLAAGLAHDTNNELMVISANAEQLAKTQGDDGPQRENVTRIQQASDTIGTLIRRVLLVGRGQLAEPGFVDVHDVVTRASPLWQQIVGSRVTLRVDTCPERRWVLADRTQLEQVLLNLVFNARDAMTGAGELHVATSLAASTEPVSEWGLDVAPGRYVCIAVTDTGGGIAPQDRPHVFELFFTTKDGEGGTGLGLFTSREIVRSLRGDLGVQSTPSGTRFTVYLPEVAWSASRQESGDAELSARSPAPSAVLDQDGNENRDPASQRVGSPPATSPPWRRDPPAR